MTFPLLQLSAVLLLLVNLEGCAQAISRDFSPPPSGETVSVTVKVPKDLAANTMRVMYRSEKCPISRSDGDGNRYKIDGGYAIEIEPKRQGQSDLYEARLPRDGGGTCQWKLSNVTFGVHYESTSQFGREVEFAGGGKVIAVFDYNMPQQLSMHGFVDASGDIVIKAEYFPWVSEIFLNGHRKVVEIYGRQRFLTYRSLSARKVLFEPILHADMVVKTIGVKSMGKGEKVENIYPDGTKEFARTDPNIERLMEMLAK